MEDVVGDGLRLGTGCACADDKSIGKRTNTGQVEYDDVVGLLVESRVDGSLYFFGQISSGSGRLMRSKTPLRLIQPVSADVGRDRGWNPLLSIVTGGRGLADVG